MKVLCVFLLIFSLSATANDTACPSKDAAKDCVRAAQKLIDVNKLDSAKALLEPVCKYPFPDACAMLGAILLEEEKVKPPKGGQSRGASLVQKACDHNSGYGCMLSGFVFHNKHNEESTKLEIQLYKKSCDLKYAEGCLEYAKALPSDDLICQGLNKLPCHEGRKKIYQSACDLGEPEGCLKAVQSFPDEKDIPNLKKACDQISDPTLKTDACTLLAKTENHLSELTATEASVKKFGPMLSFSELEKKIYVGMPIGKPARVTARHVSHGTAEAIKPVELKDESGLRVNKFILISTSALDTRQRELLYDLHEEIGCFTVAKMSDSQLIMTDVAAGACK